jgi:hypothetical protein
MRLPAWIIERLELDSGRRTPVREIRARTPQEPGAFRFGLCRLPRGIRTI